MRIWATLLSGQKIINDKMMEYSTQSRQKALESAIKDACEEMGLSRPLILKKHLGDFKNFGRASFALDDFVGEHGFDTLTLEIVKNTKKQGEAR